MFPMFWDVETYDRMCSISSVKRDIMSVCFLSVVVSFNLMQTQHWASGLVLPALPHLCDISQDNRALISGTCRDGKHLSLFSAGLMVKLFVVDAELKSVNVGGHVCCNVIIIIISERFFSVNGVAVNAFYSAANVCK